MKNAAERGVKLVMMDPRETPLARHAWRFLQFHPDADVALLLSMACTIIEEGLTDPDFIAARTEGFEAFRDAALKYTPERMEAVTGIPAATVREVARAYARGPNSIIFWGMGRVAAHPRYRQLALPDRAGADDRPDRPTRHRPASAARAEQRPGRVGRRPDPDDAA